MGNIFKIISDDNPFYLYRYSTTHTFDDSDNVLFFTKLSGLLCHLKYSKESKNKLVYIFKYKCMLDVFTLFHEQPNSVLTVYPQYYITKPEQEIENLNNINCSTISQLKIGDLDGKIDRVRLFDEKFGSYITLKYRNNNTSKELPLDSIYKFNASDFYGNSGNDKIENNKKEISNLLIEVKTLKERDNALLELIKLKYFEDLDKNDKFFISSYKYLTEKQKEKTKLYNTPATGLVFYPTDYPDATLAGRTISYPTEKEVRKSTAEVSIKLDGKRKKRSIKKRSIKKKKNKK